MMKNLYRLWFSHPAVGSIVWWNLADGFAFRHPSDPNRNENAYGGGLLRHDLSAKPAYDVLDRPINTEWHTEEKTETAKTALRPSPDFTTPTPSPYRTAAKRRTRPFTLKKEKQMIR